MTSSYSFFSLMFRFWVAGKVTFHMQPKPIDYETKLLLYCHNVMIYTHKRSLLSNKLELQPSISLLITFFSLNKHGFIDTFCGIILKPS